MNLDFSEALHSVHAMATGFLQRLPYLVVASVVYALFYVAAKNVRRLVSRLSDRRRKHRNVGLVLGRLAEGALLLLGVLVALVIALPSFKPAQLIQLLGISSVAVGFAFRDILQNFLAGILILLTEPFRLGDQITVGGFEGTVEAIETRATLLRTYDGRRVVIPNATLFTDSVTVNTAFDKRRLEYDVGIGYGDDLETARALIVETLGELEGVLKDPPPEALVVDLAASSVTVRARWWIAPPRRAEALASTDRVLTALKATLTAHGIDLPFPTRQILFHDQTEEFDGDRRRQREGWPAAGQGEVPQPRAQAVVPRQVNGQSPGATREGGAPPPEAPRDAGLRA